MSECYLGEIRIFAGNYAPENWVLCNGQSLSLNQYEALYSLIGTTYGGDGRTTFNVPDLRGRIPVGQGNGTSLTGRIIGQTGGGETVTLSEAEMPTHTHSVITANTAATTQTVGPTVLYALAQPNTTAATTGLYSTAVAPNATAVVADANTLSFAGGGQPHTNTMATTCISFIMATLGMYPTRPN